MMSDVPLSASATPPHHHQSLSAPVLSKAVCSIEENNGTTTFKPRKGVTSLQMQPWSPIPQDKPLPAIIDGAHSSAQVNQPFNIDHSIFMPSESCAGSIAKLDPDSLIKPITAMPWYHVLNGVSTRGKRKLLDNRGYTYTVKREQSNGKVNWWCSVRNKTVRCRATVNQQGDEFRAGAAEHCHPPPPIKSKVIIFITIRFCVFLQYWLNLSLFGNFGTSFVPGKVIFCCVGGS